MYDRPHYFGILLQGTYNDLYNFNQSVHVLEDQQQDIVEGQEEYEYEFEKVSFITYILDNKILGEKYSRTSICGGF